MPQAGDSPEDEDTRNLISETLRGLQEHPSSAIEMDAPPPGATTLYEHPQPQGIQLDGAEADSQTTNA
jgi:hypothetical protein